jgi:predicted metalloprotease with PDZ domain
MLHHWIGQGLVRPAAVSTDNFWFTEGFTEYFAAKLMLRAGLLDRAGLADNLAEQLRAYDKNAYRARPVAAAARKHWDDRDARMIPYQRGALIAAVLDHRIRRRSDGARSLDDLLAAVRERAHDAGASLEQGEVFAIIEEFAGAKARRRVEGALLRGAVLAMPEGVVHPGLRFVEGPDGERTVEVAAVEGAAGEDAAVEGAPGEEGGIEAVEVDPDASVGQSGE